MAGWLIGGPLTDLGWEWVFFLNIPIDAVALLLAPRLLRESRGSAARHGYHALGALSVTAGLILLVYAVIDAPEVGWGDVQKVALLAGSAVLMALFAVIETPRRRCCRCRSCARARSWGERRDAPFSTVAFGMPFLVTLCSQQVLRYSPVEFGLTSIVFQLGAISGQGGGHTTVSIPLTMGRLPLRPIVDMKVAFERGPGLHDYAGSANVKSARAGRCGRDRPASVSFVYES